MMRHSLSLPHYTEHSFVGRDQEVTLVLERAARLLEGEGNQEPVLTFWGERGSGKTWLLTHLGGRLARLGFSTFNLDLHLYASRPPQFAILDVLERFQREMLGHADRLGVTPVEVSRAVEAEMEGRLRGTPVALLVDHVDAAQWDFLEALEEYLLGPLVIRPRLLVILALRGRFYPWRVPELSLGEVVEVRPFAKATETWQQLKQYSLQAAQQAALIHEISGGNPLLNILLASYSSPESQLEAVIDYLLQDVPDTERAGLRAALTALCVLRVFDEERIPPMFAAFYHAPGYQDWSYRQARVIRVQLVGYGLAHWDQVRLGYVLEPTLRRLIEKGLREREPEKWLWLHQAASAMYSRWLRSYPSGARLWHEELVFHRGQLTALEPQRSPALYRQPA